MFSFDILDPAQRVVSVYASSRQRLVTAESCTGGLIAAALTEIPGASAVVERGFITYSNDSKIDVLGVHPDTLERFGAVSAEVAEEMAQGALEYSAADCALSVTGIAGPDGGSGEKPVGLVYFGLAKRDGVRMHYQCLFTGNRAAIREQSVREGLRLLLTII